MWDYCDGPGKNWTPLWWCSGCGCEDFCRCDLGGQAPVSNEAVDPDRIPTAAEGVPITMGQLMGVE